MRKLFKLTSDHWVIVDDSQIKEGDWYIDDAKQIRKSVVSDEVYWQHRQYNREYMKITHSTEPLEDRDNRVISIKPVKSAKTFYVIKPLSLQEVKELIGEVDVETKAEKYTSHDMFWYKQGYNQALEDNKEKKYTKEDMLTIRNQLVTISSVAVELLIREKKVGNVTAWDMVQAVSKYTKWFDDYVESLYKPQTEWEVELIDGKLKLI